MGNCHALIKAIDAYLAKVDNELGQALGAAGFINTSELVDEIVSLEDLIARALTGQTRYIRRRLAESVDLGAFAEDWPEIKALDNTGDVLAQVFHDSFSKNVPKVANAYIKQVDPVLAISTLSKRTVAFVEGWSKELGKLMKLTNHKAVERLLTDHLRDGKGVPELTKALMDGGIRDEYHRARAVAVTEMLRCHSAANHEAIMQNPAVEEKMWMHTGEHKNEPRPNHVEMDRERVRKDLPFTLKGAKGGVHHPMYPRDPKLPPEESINCRCHLAPWTNSSLINRYYEEKKRLQQQAIDEDNLHFDREQGVSADANSVDSSAGNMDNVSTLASGKVGDTDGNTVIIGKKQIDTSDSEAVQREIDDFARLYANADIEHSRVITQSGDVFTLQGTESTVDPAIVGGDALRGATIMHNHPVETGERMGDSFSVEDLQFAAQHQTGTQLLVSGERRDSFTFANTINIDDVNNAWQEALDTVRENALKNNTRIRNEQELIMRTLGGVLNGFNYSGNSEDL